VTPNHALERLGHQATLQLHKRETGEDRFDILPVDPDAIRRVGRLPGPDPVISFSTILADGIETGEHIESALQVQREECERHIAACKRVLMH
jgi:hypothetical protein